MPWVNLFERNNDPIIWRRKDICQYFTDVVGCWVEMFLLV